ncbi:Aldose 1-epimerase [Polystyrenella longa]|uniref:Aldose 1-epimerase n=1 Tax=Polystyrenella longa TaxID=2528007 RepID=A0A518CSR9_9PLAN|nr:aldose 1-epimerase [Polystyrenella longa]QDU82279.1 Aldose 1-epimerase [Polystyrenella longa]
MKTITIEDQSSGSVANISLEYGFNCYSFLGVVQGKKVDVIDAAPEFPENGERPSGNGIPILFPYPNRISNGTYTWEGKEYHLPEGVVSYNNGSAIHGFCLDRPWRLIESDTNSALAQFKLSVDAPDRKDLWPADFILEVRYSISGAVLTADCRVLNCDDKPLPWGFGTHPYFKLPLVSSSHAGNCLVSLDAERQWELNDCLPTGQQVDVPEDKDLREGAYFDLLKLDDVYTGLGDKDQLECSIMDEDAGIQVAQRYGSIFREVVMFTPPGRDAICLEPYTCVTDAINLQQQGIDAGLQVLEPGQDCRFQIAIGVEEVVA